MKAPDIIYITTHNGETLSSKWTTIPFRDFENTEYIRKEALLEWAREKKKRLGKMFDAMPATAIGAKLDACKEFINKIESL